MKKRLKGIVGLNSLSFFIPIALMLIVYAFLSIFPFGEKSLIVYWDMREQYTIFFEYLKSIFSGENNLFYTFSKFLGGDMIGLFAYYLSSPFNILFFIFKNLNMSMMILLLTLLKIGFSGLTFNIYLSKKFNVSYKTLIFSTLYALSAYSIIYQQNIMWLDGVIFLPLVLIGIDKIIDSNKILCYVISLALIILSNYYVGYMIGIFSLLYFVHGILLKKDKFDKKIVINKIKIFLFSTITSVGATAILLLPTLKSLSGGKGPGTIEESSLLNIKNYYTLQFNPIEFFYRFFTGSFEWQDVLGGLPFVFCGLSTLILVILFFFNKNILKREKIISGVFLLFMVLSLQLDFLNIIWHGFNFPTGFPGRNSFLFIFLMLVIAYKSFLNLKEGTTLFHVVSTFGIMFLITLLVFTVQYKYYNFMNILVPFFIIILTIAFITIYTIKKDQKYKRILTLGLAIICSFDLIANAYMCLNKYHYENINDFNNYLSSNKQIYDYIKSNDKGFYRTEKYFRRTTNDAMMFNYNGLTSYSSSEKDAVKEFPEKLGLDRFSTTYASYSFGSTMAVDSLFGVKYLLSHKDENNFYEKINNINNTNIYKNNWALPLGFMVSNRVNNINTDMDSFNRFEIQNNIFNAITNTDSKILYPQVSPVESNSKNVEVSQVGIFKSFKRIVNSKSATIEYKFKVENEDPLYVDIYSPEQNGAYLIVDGQVIKNYFSTDDRDNLIKLGKQPIGKEISIVVNLCDRLTGSDEELDNTEEAEYLKDQEIYLGDLNIYYENINLVKEKCSELLKQPYKFEKLSSSHLKGTVNSLNDDQSMLLTIPYENAWKVKVDGVTVKPRQVCDVLMAIDLTKGEHTIEMNYIPDGLYVGIGVSLVSVALILCYLIVYRKKKRAE